MDWPSSDFTIKASFNKRSRRPSASYPPNTGSWSWDDSDREGLNGSLRGYVPLPLEKERRVVYDDIPGCELHRTRAAAYDSPR
jgi:hypothetical protein